MTKGDELDQIILKFFEGIVTHKIMNPLDCFFRPALYDWHTAEVEREIKRKVTNAMNSIIDDLEKSEKKARAK